MKPRKARVKRAAWAAAIASALLFTSGTCAADEHHVKPPVRGLVSMGAFKFVGSGGDPVNTLEPLNAKPGIFGGIVIVASWAQLQPEPTSEIEHGNVIDKAMATSVPTTKGTPTSRSRSGCASGADSRRRRGR